MLTIIVLTLLFFLIILAFRYFFFWQMTRKVCSLDPDNDYCRKFYKESLDRENGPYHKCDIVYGQTPRGGVKTVICYVGKNNNRTEKHNAIKAVVREMDEKNHVVYETWTPFEEEPG